MKQTTFLSVTSAAFILSSFLLLHSTQAIVLISQIQTAGVSTTDEYVGLYNYASSSQSIAGWSLKKQTAGGTQSAIVSSFGNITLGPFGYFLVAHRDYSPINGVQADIVYSNNSTSLADNNSALLFNETNSLVDRVDWGSAPAFIGSAAPNPGADQNLVRKPNDDSGNGTDTDDSSQDFLITPSAPFNSGSPARPNFSAPPPNDQTSTPNPAPINWSSLKINEFLPNPANGAEWVELFNTGDSAIDLSSSILCDNRMASCTIASPTGTIAARSWATVYLEGSHLNNSGDSVILKDPNGATIDQVAYSGTLIPEQDQSVARKNDGTDTDTDNDWALTTSPTPNAANSITAPAPKISTGGGGGGASPTTPTTPYPLLTTTSLIYATSTSPVTLNEIFPDPAGSDIDNEFIEIKNISGTNIDLGGWKISDLHTYVTLTSTLAASEMRAYGRTVTKINLSNTSAQKIYLLNSHGEVASYIAYSKATPQASLSRTASGDYSWTTHVTRGSENIFIRPDTVQIVWKINAPWGTAPGATTTFDASLSADPRGGKIHFMWQFGDGVTSTGAIVQRIFTSTGTFPIYLIASSTQGTYSEKQMAIEVGESIGANMGDLVLSEIYSNPADDENREYIELFNTSGNSIPLDGWEIKNNNTTFTIPSSTTLAAHSYITFFRVATHIALNNTSDTVTLLSPFGTTVDKIRLTKSPDGESYSRFGSSWRWTSTLTPGETNGAVLGEKIVTPAAQATTKSTVYQGRQLATPSSVRALSKGAAVKFTGIVTAPPGIFSARYMYVGDTSGGIEVYNTKTNLPPLTLGDMVTINGTVSSLNNVPRVNVKNSWDVVVASHSQPLPTSTIAEDANEDPPLGGVATLTGEVTEISGNTIYLDDGQNENIVYLRQATKIPKNLFIKGENMQVTGILETSKSGPQLLPRYSSDIIDLGPSSDLQKTNITISTNSSSYPYTTATIGGVGALALALVAQKRKQIILFFQKTKNSR